MSLQAGPPRSPGALPRAADEDEPVLPPLTPVLAEGEALVQPPMDQTPNDSDADPPSRIPHLGHTLLFIAMAAVLFLIAQGILFAGSSHPSQLPPVSRSAPATAPRNVTPTVLNPKLAIASEAIAFLATLGCAALLFPRLWKRPFLMGLSWNAPAAGRNVLRLVPLGFALSFSVQAASSLVSTPKSIPVDDFFRTPSDAWMVTFFGVLLAPAFEEILFRGFLFPALAIAYDWLALPRTEAALESWRSSNALTVPAMVFSAVFSSLPFALMHGQQTAFTWPVLALLFGVSMVLTFVRMRLRSVAASALVHASYNMAIFISALIATGGYRHLDRIPR